MPEIHETVLLAILVFNIVSEIYFVRRQIISHIDITCQLHWETIAGSHWIYSAKIVAVQGPGQDGCQHVGGPFLAVEGTEPTGRNKVRG